jgi:lipid-binding SYLF domain-containing protein
MVMSSGSGRSPALARRAFVLGAAAAAMFAVPGAAHAANAADLDYMATASLNQLYASSPKARAVSERALAVLIFPKITKAGFIVGGQGGLGVLRVKGKTQGYFKIGAGSVGLQAGVQEFSYALFFITQSSLDYVKSNNGWALGSGPSMVVVDAGFAKTMNTNTLKKDIYSFAFGQKGLMAGLGLEGSKISKAHPKR